MKRILSILLSVVMVLSLGLVSASATEEEAGNGPVIEDYDTFLLNLGLLEQLALMYVDEVDPGKDPLDLVIKYVRTGVDRYNSGSWGIMAGYEDPNFAAVVAAMEEDLNQQAVDEGMEPFILMTGLKNLKNFRLPNGDKADIGHVFGTMDITYHNNFSVNHADVAGWAGDLVDLLEFADKGGVSGSLDEMVAEVSKNYLGVTPPMVGQSGFNHSDILGDLDGFYIMKEMQKNGYEMSGLAVRYDAEVDEYLPDGIMAQYFTEDLTEEARVAYFLKNRLNGASTRSEIRDAVYNAYIGNKVVATLEGTREFTSDSTTLNNLKKACCYAFADYLCKLAGDYVEETDRSYFEVFSSETSMLAPGVKQEIKLATTIDGKQTKFYVATADITRADVNVYANYMNNDPTTWGLQRVLDQANAAQAKYGDPSSANYIENYSVVASTNGAGFDMKTGEPGGLLVMGGVEYHPINASGFFGILKDGTAVIGTTEEYNTIYKDQVQEGIAGFGATLVKDGKIAVAHSDNIDSDRASRTAVGITKTGKVVLMVMDGRQEPASCGGSMQEIAQVMLEAGCYHAVNLDGGGSTTYVAKPEGAEELEVVNVPSDGVQRSVSGTLMIVSTAPSSTAFDHALVESDVDYMTVGANIEMTAAGVSATGNSAEVPEGAFWDVSDKSVATITEDGVLTALSNGDVDVNLMLGDEIIGTKTIGVVTPDNLYFARTNMNAIYGEALELPIKALYNRKEVATTAEDFVFAVTPEAAGEIDGLFFTAEEKSGVRAAQIVAMLPGNDERAATITLSLYSQDEVSFDFDNATGGDRTLAWKREVSNAKTEDGTTYKAEDSNVDMVTTYSLGLDMTHIPIPAQLEDLTEMLPGADLEGASAWMFLCQLAERVSVMTEVKPVVKFDPNVDVDCSELEIITDYFELTETAFDEATNTVALTLRWKDQTQAIDPATANPLCIVNGIRLTPKDSAQWTDKGRLAIVNSGDISYKICLRAGALVSFAQNPENQAIYGLYPYVNPDDPSDAGAYFASTYAQFEDSYTLDKALKNGWILEDDGLFAYYVNGVKTTGVYEVDGVYYDFGTNGVNAGQTPYTGIFTSAGKTYYAKQGKLETNVSYILVGEQNYHCHADGTAHKADHSTTLDCTHGGQSRYRCHTCNKWEYVGSYINPDGHDWDANHVCKDCGTVGKNIANATITFGSNNPEYYYQKGGMRPSFTAKYDGKNLTYSNDNNLDYSSGVGKMRDLYISWTNDDGIGKASMSVVGRGDYYGEKTLEYKLVPQQITGLKATATHNSITLSWNAALGASKYNVYKYLPESGNRTLLATTDKTSYTFTKLTPNTEYHYVLKAIGMTTDGTNTECVPNNKNLLVTSPVTVTTSPKPVSSGAVTSAAITAGNNKVTMLRVDGAPYFFLPADADPTKLNLSLTLADEVKGEKVSVGGNLKTVSGTANGTNCALTLNLSQLASKDADGGYTVSIAVSDYSAMSVKILQGANIPSMFITSDDPTNEGRDFVDAKKTNETTAKLVLTGADGTVIHNGDLTQLKARGNSTFAHFAKKSYQIKLDKKDDLIGQDENVKTWVLLANYGDATLMHDKFFKDLAAQMDMPYVAGCDWVNLWYDGEYRGVYLLSEKNSVGSTAVDITDMEKAYEALNAGYGDAMQTAQGTNAYGNAYAYTKGLTDPAEITGGYLIELNHAEWDEVNGFKTSKGKGFNVKSPEWASDAAMKYISEYYQAFENAVYATDANGKYTGYNAETGKYFYDYVDMDSLVKVFLIQELGLNPDGFISSLYFYKDVDGKLYAGPIWDQDMTLGTGWTLKIGSGVVDYHYLAEALIQIPVFKARVSEYFKAEFAPMIRAALAAGGTIDDYYALLADNAELNYILWPYIRVGDPSTANHIWANTNYDAVVADMESWMTARLAVLENNLVLKYEPGDANHDGKTDSSDAVLILQQLAGYAVPGFDAEAADFNGDGKADSSDAVAILQKLAGY